MYTSATVANAAGNLKTGRSQKRYKKNVTTTKKYRHYTIGNIKCVFDTFILFKERNVDDKNCSPTRH